ncbi:MAG: hypothetical protein M1836_005883 [Candelina mexicana]|nr:MAG: hypothetical protein M1836_005883 [Candelina mexicana]
MSTNRPTNHLIHFYEPVGGGTDSQGRTLASILVWNDWHLEFCHDYIQTLFPLPEDSPFNPEAPVIDRRTFDAFHTRPELRDRLHDSLIRMLEFYGFRMRTSISENGKESVVVEPGANFSKKAKNWVMRFNHNHLRITRIIRSLRVLGLEEEAAAFYFTLEKLCEADEHSRIGGKSRMFWKRAAKRPLYMAPEDESDDDEDGPAFLHEYESRRHQGESSEGQEQEDNLTRTMDNA